jgi:hypothetical protein
MRMIDKIEILLTNFLWKMGINPHKNVINIDNIISSIFIK